jgi:hypothetical protein
LGLKYDEEEAAVVDATVRSTASASVYIDALLTTPEAANIYNNIYHQ